MSNLSMRKNLKSSVSTGILIGVTLLLSACSSNVTRFDYPAMGYNSDDQDMSSFNGGFGGSSNTTSQPAAKPFVDYNSYNNDRYKASQTTTTASNKVASYNRGSVQSETVTDLSTPNYQPRRIANFNNSRKAAVKSYSQTANNTSGNSVTVQSGDTLYSISRRYGMKPADFMAANNMSDVTIRLGQVLQVPSKGGTVARLNTKRPAKVAASKFQYASDRNRKTASNHTVSANETLYSVARKYGVSYLQLARWNGLDQNAGLRAGQVLALKADAAAKPRRVARLKEGASRTDSGSNGLWVAEQPKSVQRKVSKPRVAEPKVAVIKVKPVRIKKVQTRKVVKKAALKVKKGGFRWPVRGRIITKFGPMANGKNNDGVNFAVPMGTEVKAAENGVVAYAGSELKGYGKLVLIRHANNFVSAYAHNSALKVKRGDRIKRGAVVALVGKTGDVTHPQLHFELRKGAKPIDPTQYMAQ